jgi:hypothetical protein
MRKILKLLLFVVESRIRAGAAVAKSNCSQGKKQSNLLGAFNVTTTQDQPLHTWMKKLVRIHNVPITKVEDYKDFALLLTAKEQVIV